jgi:hypothetical protein
MQQQRRHVAHEPARSATEFPSSESTILQLRNATLHVRTLYSCAQGMSMVTKSRACRHATSGLQQQERELPLFLSNIGGCKQVCAGRMLEQLPDAGRERVTN